MIVSCNLLWGGKVKYEKKEKETKQKTGEVSFIYNFLEVDSSRNVVNSKSYFNDSDIDTSKLELLKPCLVEFEISAMSDFKKFISVKPVK